MQHKKPANTMQHKKTVPAAGTVRRNVKSRARLQAERRKRALRRRIVFGAAVLLILVLIIMLICSACSGKNDVTNPTPTPEPTAAATAPAVTAVPTVAPTAQPIVYLPVIETASTSQMKICITVDDCFQADNLNTLLDMMENYGQKITVFPIGHVIMEKPDVQQALRRAYSLGMEIENHTYSHSKLYAMTDEEMAADICKQSMAVNYALGVDYEMHFLRMMGGNGEDDLRSHQYLVQLGNYKGIAHWGISGSDATLKQIKKNLKPGMIYLFHTTDDDLKKLKEFIPYAVSMGYQLVTLNEMLGYESNAVSALSGDPLDVSTIPTPLPFVYTEYVEMDVRVHTQMYCVQLVQRRLQELGYLSYSATVDGDYGSTTQSAILMFQNAAGLKTDGICGKGTQTALFSDTAPVNTGSPVEPKSAS